MRTCELQCHCAADDSTGRAWSPVENYTSTFKRALKLVCRLTSKRKSIYVNGSLDTSMTS